jgi:hypothetical protein
MQLGVTFWRLQNLAGSNEAEQKRDEFTLEQVESSAKLTVGSMVRLGIEPFRDGYIYVIDREQYADGTYGPAFLVFPTMRTDGGENRVVTNRLVLIPSPSSYFRITPSSTNKLQRAEALTIILSPVPILFSESLGANPLAVSDQLLRNMETQWSSPVSIFELNGGAGLTTSNRNQAQIPLTQNDPLPQTIYRAAVAKGKPLLITVLLSFQPSANSTRN